MKSILTILPALLGVGIVSLTSCTSREDLPSPDDSYDNVIRFAANTEFSRAADITTNSLETFNVYAYTGTATSPVTFMDNVVVTKSSNNKWTYSPVKYWPADEAVDFYAFAPASWVGTSTPKSPISYDAYPGTEDIIYAVSPGLKGAAGTANAQVLFNFRHALAKVSIKLSSTNTDLQVKVSNVALANIMTRGNFHFPSASTADKPSADNIGYWTDQNTPVPYIYHMSQDAGDLITLTTTATDMSTTGLGMGGAKYMMPQLLSWRSNGSGNDTYLTVMCSVYDAKSGAKLWPNANTPAENIVEGSTYGDGLLKFPLSTSSFSEWYPGYHYVYNLVINSNEEMGAIEFGTPTVDTYVDITTNYQ